VTYRAEGHSTSDDPSKYRPQDEAKAWPLGDPINRLRQHLVARRAWSDERQVQLDAEIAEMVRTAGKAAEAFGVLGSTDRLSPATMFDDVYKDQPWHLRQQRQQAGF
jgi:2-oxoisovalerate dehydrogenase E1 component alpha subunit